MACNSSRGKIYDTISSHYLQFNLKTALFSYYVPERCVGWVAWKYTRTERLRPGPRQEKLEKLWRKIGPVVFELPLAPNRKAKARNICPISRTTNKTNKLILDVVSNFHGDRNLDDNRHW